MLGMDDHECCREGHAVYEGGLGKYVGVLHGAAAVSSGCCLESHNCTGNASVHAGNDHECCREEDAVHGGGSGDQVGVVHGAAAASFARLAGRGVPRGANLG